MTSTDDRYVSLDEAAERFGVSARTLRRRIADGVLPAYRMAPGRLVKVRLNEAEAALLRRIPTAAGSR